ncbi:THAP4-like heme-binding beta-barrel domain-containing protein [Plasmodiophora brassicae]|uniref:THAP4-like heme-binding domain-containing protein n=1 Tax=Plasmodiophora brassicae TaxID=37360 RepID=A0A0G4J600_PLABS|nr:hypothetical protein PBRA_002648 [Plasmodiophora brassicae]
MSAHAAVAVLQPLIGTWVGEGEGQYPTIAPFRYRDHIRFYSSGQPFLFMEQRTKRVDSETPMHSEMGFWRVANGRSVEVAISHAMGLTEVSEGSACVDGMAAGALVVTLESTTLGRVSHSTRPHVVKLRRAFTVAADGSRLEYTVEMATDQTPLHLHLRASLIKAEEL